jgi:hypothetical protein
MATVHPFPIRLDAIGSAQIATQLSLAHAQGENLGCRTPQMHALASSLESLVERLRLSVAYEMKAGDLDAETLALFTAPIEHLAAHTETLIRMVHQLP